MSRIEVGRVSRALAIPEARLRGLGLRAYDAGLDADAPAFFMGLYDDDDLAALLAHRGPAIQMFCGGDARHVAWAASAVQLAKPRVRVLAPKLLVPALMASGVTAEIMHGVFAGDPPSFALVPMGQRVYAYCPYERRQEYGVALLAEVASRCPDVGFYLGRWGDHAPPFANALPLPAWISPDDVRRVYADCFCGVRTVAQDGFPGTPVEMALMGRPTAHVVDVGVPWIDVAPDAAAMAAFVRRATLLVEPDVALADMARAHVVDRSFLDLDGP